MAAFLRHSRTLSISAARRTDHRWKFGFASVAAAGCVAAYTALVKEDAKTDSSSWVKRLSMAPPKCADKSELVADAQDAAASIEARNAVSEEVSCSTSEKELSTDHNVSWSFSVSGKKFPLQREFRDKNITLPVISLETVRDNDDHEGQVWVTLDGGVYNVTTFLDAHPGGATRIMMVDGNDLSAFWAIYKLHNRKHIRQLLEGYRIGSLSEADATRAEEESSFSSYYQDDPERPRADELRIPSRHPWNSEPSPEVLVESFFTPNDKFFVRNHNNVPLIDEDEWELEIEGNAAIGIEERTFTLNDIKTRFERVEVIATLQCAGNRQEDFITADRPLYVAPHWRGQAIGNAKWAGVRVRDVLRECGMDVDAIALRQKGLEGMKIVNFIAEDVDETGVPYAGVIPVEKVVDPFGDAILAYEMNGETLPRDHGYPVRLLAPGHAGCRNVKWVRQIAVTAEASELDSGSRLDRHFAPDIQWQDHLDHIDPDHEGHCKVRTDQGPVIQTLPVQSVIALPADHSRMSGHLDTVTVAGVAWSGGGRGICRVELSTDGGNTFTAAELSQCPKEIDCPPPEQGAGRNWAWHQFKQELPIPESARAQLEKGEVVHLDIACKAIDGDFNAQPEKMEQIWNVLGICSNHWSHATVVLDPSIPADAAPGKRPAQPEPGCYIWPDDELLKNPR